MDWETAARAVRRTRDAPLGLTAAVGVLAPEPPSVLTLTLESVAHDPQSEERSRGEPMLATVAEIEARERVNRGVLGVADGLAYLGATAVVAWLTGQSLRLGVLAVPPFAVLVAKIAQLYARDEAVISKTSVAEWRQVLQTAALTSIGIYLAWRVVSADDHSGGMRSYLMLILAAFVFSIAGRSLARRLARAIVRPERCVIIGNPQRVTAMASRLVRATGVRFLGTIPDNALDGSVAELRAAVEQLNVHRILIAPTAGTSDETTLHLIQAAKFLGVRVSLVPSAMAAVGGVAVFDDVDGMVILGVPGFGLSRSSRHLKRAFDLIVGAVVFVLLLPVILVVSVMIKLDSPGPILFHQTRVGRDGRPFDIVKFRSMVAHAETLKYGLLEHNEAAEGLFKIAEDPRVTRVGRRIRSTHLDELPQLINVLRGEMSLVGPRPLIVEEDARMIGLDRHRTRLTPGMTGPWQIRGPLQAPLSEMAKLDYMYASTWSIWQDVDILIKTFARVMHGGGN